MLPTGDIGDWCAESRQVWRSLVLQTTVDSHAEFVVDSLRYIQPVQFVVQYFNYLLSFNYLEVIKLRS